VDHAPESCSQPRRDLFELELCRDRLDSFGFLERELFALGIGVIAGAHDEDAPLSARRPASVMRKRAISIGLLPAMTLSAVAVASPAFTSSTIMSIVKTCAIMIASVQPSRQEASSSRARRRLVSGRHRRRFLEPLLSFFVEDSELRTPAVPRQRSVSLCGSLSL
jgi:hypothetical protein